MKHSSISTMYYFSAFTQFPLSFNFVSTRFSLRFHTASTQFPLSFHSVFPQFSLSFPSVFPQFLLGAHLCYEGAHNLLSLTSFWLNFCFVSSFDQYLFNTYFYDSNSCPKKLVQNESGNLEVAHLRWNWINYSFTIHVWRCTFLKLPIVMSYLHFPR